MGCSCLDEGSIPSSSTIRGIISDLFYENDFPEGVSSVFSNLFFLISVSCFFKTLVDSDYNEKQHSKTNA